MYLVLNLTTRIITLSDLDITFKANQLLDLDKMNKTLIKPEDSKYVKVGLKTGKLRLINHDRIIVNEIKKPEVKEVKQESSLNEQNIINSVTEALDKKNKETNKEVLELLYNLSGKLGIEKEDKNISEDLMKQIHSRKLDKLIENTSKSIENTEHTKVKDEQIQNQINNLEDFLN